MQKLSLCSQPTPWVISWDIYPWTSILDFVLVRVPYDSWLVVTALVKKIPVVDATETVMSLHQTGTYGNSTSFRAKFERYIGSRL